MVASIVTLLALVVPVAGGAPHAVPRRAVPGELLVIRRAGALEPRGAGRLTARDGATASLLARHGLDQWAPMSGPTGRESGAWIKLRSSRPDFDAAGAARELMAAGAVVAAAPNVVLSLHPTIPNDTYLGDQYWVADLGDGDVQLTDAWDIVQGDTSVVIGVMDTGVDRGHPDLAAQIWRNPVELLNGVDDDGDGYIDDVNGWDFGNGDNDPDPHAVFDVSGIDIGFHGTFVSAIASAATNNAEGIAGAGWKCRILPLKVVNDAGEITLEASAAAFRYAWAHGVHVLNMSLGTEDTLARTFFQALVDSATDAGVLCVASAGNSGTSTPSYPAACDRVLAVGATTEFNQRADFSNWGPWVDVSAPGSVMWSALCRNYMFDEVTEIIYIYFFGWDGETPYMYGDGTSFSCPLVAGVCGLIRAQRPAYGPEQTASHLVLTGDALTFDHPIGRKLNAYRAASAVLGVSDAARSAPATATPNPFRSSMSIRFELTRPGTTDVSIYDVTGRLMRTVLASTLPAGRHEVVWDGTLGGTAAAPGLYFVRVETPQGRRTLRAVRID